MGFKNFYYQEAKKRKKNSVKEINGHRDERGTTPSQDVVPRSTTNSNSVVMPSLPSSNVGERVDPV